jgi:LysR family transcriptional regulator, transcriptional activator of nhaA
MKINLNHLYQFYVVGKEGTINRASNILHVTQPTISKQIKDLEDHLGLSLFARKSKHLSLTDDGRQLLTKAERIFLLVEELEFSLAHMAQVGHTTQTKEDQIHLGVVPLLSQMFFSHLAFEWWKESHSRFKIYNRDYLELMRMLKNDEVDAVISDYPYMGEEHCTFQSHQLGRIKMVVVAHPQFAHLQEKFPKSMSDAPFISYMNQSKYQEHLDYYFRLNGIHPNSVCEFEDINLIRTAAENAVEEKKLVRLGTLPWMVCSAWVIVSNTKNRSPMLRRLLKSAFSRSSERQVRH